MSDLRRFVPYAWPVTTEREPRNQLFSAIRTDWREIGGLGRFALLGVLVSLVVAVVLVPLVLLVVPELLVVGSGGSPQPTPGLQTSSSSQHMP